MRLELSRRAQADIDDIRDYSVEHSGPARAIRYLDAIEDAFRRVVDHPRIGASMDDLVRGMHGLPVGQHRLYYEINDDIVLILRILHQATDATRYL